jgi:signal transduction histidine kinase/DNA-binding response OmpR family regulator
MQSADGGVLEPFAWSPVLIVDDDESSALLALKLLLRAGLRSVDTITDARLVLDWVEDHDPDLVLLDLHMPFLDGYGVLTALRQRATSTELPVIVLTADDTLEASGRALELGANDFLLKPLQPTALTHRTRNLLDMRAAHRSLHRRQRWLEEAERFSREVFSGEIETPLLTMAGRALELADADHVLTMGCRPELGGDRDLSVPRQRFEAPQSGTATGLVIDLGERLSAEVAGNATPMLIEDAKADPELKLAGADDVDIGPMMLLPVPGAESTRCVIGLLRQRGREPYSASDLEVAHQFVTRAAIAVELVDRRADRQRLEVARESFFASLSHDLRTPLNSIQGFVEMIPIVDEPRRGEFIDRVQSNVGRLTVLIDNLLDHARLRAGAVPLSPQMLEAAAVASGCVRDLAPLLANHDVIVGTSDLEVYADPQALGRVLGNLLVNAARYSPDGTPIEVTFESDADVGRIIVTDHGRGIAEDDLKTIFDEFERGALAEPDGGTGLGLSSVRQLVTLQNGSVLIDSAPGRGTTVTVKLPLAGPGS